MEADPRRDGRDGDNRNECGQEVATGGRDIGEERSRGRARGQGRGGMIGLVRETATPPHGSPSSATLVLAAWRELYVGRDHCAFRVPTCYTRGAHWALRALTCVASAPLARPAV